MDKYTDSKQRIEKIERKYDTKARQNFSKPAKFCQFCGQPMTKHTDEMKERWQTRWSIHYDCAHAVDDQLDRAVGIVSERKGR